MAEAVLQRQAQVVGEAAEKREGDAVLPAAHARREADRRVVLEIVGLVVQDPPATSPLTAMLKRGW
jgi:hypothetical protein